MEIHYRPIRKVHRPIAPELARALLPALAGIRCGYLEVLAMYGSGSVAGEIGILDPSAVAEATADFRRNLNPVTGIPGRVAEDCLDRALVLAVHARRTLLCDPQDGESLLIHDGDCDKLYLNTFGFADPRYGFHDQEFFHGRDFDLIFDSGLHRASMQAVSGDGGVVRVMDAVGNAVARWFVPGDLQAPGVSKVYLSKLGGYLSISNESEETFVDLLTIDFDLDERAAVEDYMGLFSAAGYRLIRF